MLTSKVKFVHRGLFLVGISLVMGALFVWGKPVISALSTANSTCDSTVHLVKPQAGQIVSGTVKLEAYVPSYLQAAEVKFITENNFIGNAQKLSTGTWGMDWNTSSMPSGPVRVSVGVTYPASTGTLSYCLSPSVEFLVENNTAVHSLSVELEPTEWAGPTNVNTQFRARIFLLSSDSTDSDEVTDQSQISWSTNIGKVEKSGDKVVFSSGPVTGVGSVKATAYYGGKSVAAGIKITVLSQSDSTSYPYNGDSSDNSSSDDDLDIDDDEDLTSDDQDAATATRNKFYGDQLMEDCFKAILGDDFETIFSSGSRLSYEQLSRVSTCLAGWRFVLPANLAPVDPVKVPDLPASPDLKVEAPEQALDRDGNPRGLVLKGSAKPGSSVLVYIFSEPLVLTTEADDSGNWTYVLEDPLEPGDHQVYVAVEENGEFVRSEAFSFSLAQVASTEDNPNGLSLTLVGNSRNMTVYVLGAAVLVLIGLSTLMVIIHKKTQIYHSHAPQPEPHDGARG